MSFASEVKVELSKLKIKDNEKTALLAGLLQTASVVSLNSEGIHVTFQTMNNNIARCVVQLVKDLYNKPLNIIVRKHNLTKNDVYILTFDDAEEIINEFELFNKDYSHYIKHITDEETRLAFLRGAFLASGSINNPAKSYHLEIKCMTEELAIFIQMMINSFRLNARISKRRTELIVYLKEAQTIADFLYRIGASKAYFQFENERVNKDVINSINRKNNCELANEYKAVNAASQQLEDIRCLESVYERLDIKLMEVIDIRKKNPTASFNELLEIYKEEYGKELSKSGLSHRFKKIHELASDPEKKYE